MSFKPLRHILGSLEDQTGWQEQQQYWHLRQCWAEIVGPIVEAQTRPTGITRGVLRVATSSAVWAQNLAFERHRILKKLNATLSKPLVDIRFSTGQWQQKPSNPSDLEHLWQKHPSQLPSCDDATLVGGTGDTSQTAFSHWAERVQARSRHLPHCPDCHCPTPPGELQRWSTCALCAAKKWA